MKLNAKDLKDLEGVVYWLSAAKGDLDGVEKFTDHALEMIEKASKCAERIMLGENRK
jgi:hypothetical protein